ncbi:MAG: hypothetical protein IPP19_07200 [Verrucomicrobia bacterium]|nr:hypothetical protein [Verrucomicrobiota bacterium]
MSTKILVIPEDFTKDEHILKPLVEKLVEEAGFPRATVTVCRDPNFQGVAAAMNESRIRTEVIERYPMVDIFIQLVDRDGLAGREVAARNLETKFNQELAPKHKRFFAELARQEVEVFILAGHELDNGVSWQVIRDDANVKNTFFQSLVRREGTESLPHQGRKKLMAAAIRNFQRIMSRCDDDLGNLLERLRHQ